MTKSRKIVLSISGFLLLAVIVLSFTWERLLFRISGIKPYALETKESVLEYAKAHADTKSMIVIPSSLEYHIFLTKDFGTPGCIIFNRDSLPINSNHNTDCQWVAMTFLENASKDSNYAVNTNGIQVRHLNDILQRVDHVKEAPTSGSDSLYDFIVVYAWAKYFPKSADFSKELNKMDVKDKRIALISLNLDYSDRWMSQDSLDELNNADIEISFAKR